MLNRSVRHILVAANVVMCFAAGVKVHAQTATPRSAAPNKETRVTRATGSFDVKLNPLAAYNDADGALLGRFSIDKQTRGDLEATSKGEMLTAGGSVKNSAGYVAVERVTGTLHGRGGSFALAGEPGKRQPEGADPTPHDLHLFASGHPCRELLP